MGFRYELLPEILEILRTMVTPVTIRNSIISEHPDFDSYILTDDDRAVFSKSEERFTELVILTVKKVTGYSKKVGRKMMTSEVNSRIDDLNREFSKAQLLYSFQNSEYWINNSENFDVYFDEFWNYFQVNFYDILIKEFHNYLKRVPLKNEGIIVKVTKHFSMKEGTETVWDAINKFINLKAWAVGNIFDADPVDWIDGGGKYTLMLFIDRITRYEITNKFKNDLVNHPTVKGSTDWRKVFVTTHFLINGNVIDKNDLNDPRKKQNRTRNVRLDFLLDLDLLIKGLNEKPYNRNYTAASD